MRRYRMQQALITLLGVVLIALVFLICAGAGHAASMTQRNKNHAHQIAEQLRAAGHPEDHPVILACQAWWREEDAKERAEIATAPAGPRNDAGEGALTEEARAKTGGPVGAQRSGSDGERSDSGAYELCASERSESRARGSDDWPVAAEVWRLLREAGLSEACAAGILGNMAQECGGGTLELMPYTYAGGYYGLCMWSLYYFPEADGLSVAAQVQLLLDTLESNIRAGGGSLSAFAACEDARSAARYFSDFYERPAAWSEKRADAAEAAYKYFTGN